MSPPLDFDDPHTPPPSTMFGYVMAAFVACVLILGGASRENALNEMILRLLSLLALAWAVLRLSRRRASAANHRFAIGLLLATLALPLLQLLPLPPEIWSALPGQSELAGEFHQLGVEIGWRPLSLAPAATLEVFLSLLPPAAVFLGILTLDRSARAHVIFTILAVTLVSIVLGALQIAGGADSVFRLYDTTNREVAVGFFSNRNHWAASLVIAFPLIAALLIGVRSGSTPLAYALASGLFAVLLVGIAISGSRAGFVFALPALGGALAIILRQDGGLSRRKYHSWSLIVGASVALMAISIAGAWLALDRLDTKFEDEVRFDFWRRTVVLAIEYFPMGAGGGSFPSVYPAAEPIEALSPNYANRAHNDFVELFLEYGIVSAALILFAIVLTIRALRANRADRPIALCHLLVLVLLAGHSLADYPLRTSALAVVFAFSLSALLSMTPANARR